MSILFLICADETTERNLRFQNTLLEKVFLFVDNRQRATISGGKSIEDICSWVNIRDHFFVKCECDNKILKLQFAKLDTIGLVNIRYLPNSLQDFQVSHCSQKQEIITRTFPRMAHRLSFVGNRFFGIPDLTRLPVQLERLYLNQNSLTGPINLCSLPETLICLNFRQNMIDEEYIFYKDLPKNLTGIYLGSNKHIGGIHAFPETEKTTKKHLFHQIEEKKIH